MMITKVAIDATIAIIIATFLSSSGRFILTGLSEPLLFAIVERVKRFFDTIVDSIGFEIFCVVVVMVAAIVVTVAVFVLVVLKDMLGVCVVGANRIIGSWIKKVFVNIGFKIFNIICLYLTPVHTLNKVFLFPYVLLW